MQLDGLLGEPRRPRLHQNALRRERVPGRQPHAATHLYEQREQEAHRVEWVDGRGALAHEGGHRVELGGVLLRGQGRGSGSGSGSGSGLGIGVGCRAVGRVRTRARFTVERPGEGLVKMRLGARARMQ